MHARCIAYTPAGDNVDNLQNMLLTGLLFITEFEFLFFGIALLVSSDYRGLLITSSWKTRGWLTLFAFWWVIRTPLLWALGVTAFICVVLLIISLSPILVGAWLRSNNFRVWLATSDKPAEILHSSHILFEKARAPWRRNFN